jgi:hypothetical protein
VAGALRIVRGAAEGAEIPIRADFVIGRGETGIGNLQGDPEISRRHALFRPIADGRIAVEDLGSTNGTFVNGERITGRHVLSPGDTIQFGHTTIRYEAEAPPAVAAQATPLAARPAAPPPVPAVPVAPAYRADPTPRRVTPLMAALVLILIAVGVLAGYLIGNSGSDKKTTTVTTSAGSAPVSVGSRGGAGTTKALGTVYIESNIAKPNGNTIIAYSYGDGGNLHPLSIRTYPTGGAGSADLTDSGVLDADQHLWFDPQKRILFAVNQGSDTIAVFEVAGDGGLTPVDGSPFPSGGMAPASVGVRGDTLVVVNKAQDGVRKLDKIAPNYTTFTIGSDGSLKPTGSKVDAPAGNSPTQALISTDGKVVMSSEEGGPLRAFTLDPGGKLTQGPNSPVTIPASAYPKQFDPKLEWALGLGVHPKQKIMYGQLATIHQMGIFTYDDEGNLNFVKGVRNSGGDLPCWTLINKAGTRLYTDNAGNNTMTVYDITDPMNPKQIQLLKLKGNGNPWDVRFSPDEKYIFMVDPRARDNVKPGEGQAVHSLVVGSDGKLAETTEPAPIPVELNVNPIGVAVAPSG